MIFAIRLAEPVFLFSAIVAAQRRKILVVSFREPDVIPRFVLSREAGKQGFPLPGEKNRPRIVKGVRLEKQRVPIANVQHEVKRDCTAKGLNMVFPDDRAEIFRTGPGSISEKMKRFFMKPICGKDPDDPVRSAHDENMESCVFAILEKVFPPWKNPFPAQKRIGILGIRKEFVPGIPVIEKIFRVGENHDVGLFHDVHVFHFADKVRRVTP